MYFLLGGVGARRKRQNAKCSETDESSLTGKLFLLLIRPARNSLLSLSYTSSALAKSVISSLQMKLNLVEHRKTSSKKVHQTDGRGVGGAFDVLFGKTFFAREGEKLEFLTNIHGVLGQSHHR
jgi:hypothetical protein